MELPAGRYSALKEKLGEHYLLCIPLLVSLASIGARYRLVGLTMDGVTYLQIARNILFGKGLGWQATWASPLHSILVAAASYLSGVTDLLAVVSALSAVLGLLLVPAVYFLAYQAFGRRTALLAALLAAVSPHLLTIAGSPETEITYTFFLTLSLGLFTLAITRASWWYATWSGLGFALAYLSRSEGFLVMALVILGVLALQGRRFYRSRTFALSLATVLVFAVVAAPYLLFLKKNYGAWVISPKASYVMIWMKCFTYHDNNLGEEGNPELWGLTASGKLGWQEPRGVGELVSYLASDPGKHARVYLHNLSRELPGRIPNGSGMERFPQLFPVYLALAALGALCAGWGASGRVKKAILCAPFLVLLILPVFTDGWWKYLVPYLPIFLILAAQGLGEAARLAAFRFGGRAGNALLAVITAGVLLHFLSAFYPAAGGGPAPVNPRQAFKNALRAESEQAGAYALRLFGPGHNYMSSWNPIIYHLDGLWTARPAAPLEQQLAYARRNNVDFLVGDVVGGSLSVEDMMHQRGLQLVGLYQSQIVPFKVGFYRIPDR